MGHHTRRPEPAHKPDLRTELTYIWEDAFRQNKGQFAYVLYNSKSQLTAITLTQDFPDHVAMTYLAHRQHEEPKYREWHYAFKMDVYEDLSDALAQTGLDFSRLKSVDDLRAACAMREHFQDVALARLDQPRPSASHTQTAAIVPFRAPHHA